MAIPDPNVPVRGLSCNCITARHLPLPCVDATFLRLHNCCSLLESSQQTSYVEDSRASDSISEETQPITKTMIPNSFFNTHFYKVTAMTLQRNRAVY